MHDRFVRPETTVLHLAPREGQEEPDWLLVRTHLNEGERRAMFARMYVETQNDDRPLRLDPQMVGVSFVLAYLLDWSLVDEAGNRVIITDRPAEAVRQMLDRLFPDEFTEIREAIERHAAKVSAARAEKKRAMAIAS